MAFSPTRWTPGLAQTGIAGLDEVLVGGNRRGNLVLVEGAPGAGKTTVGLELVYRGVLETRKPGLILSFEMGAEKLTRDAAGFGWDFAQLASENLIKIVHIQPAQLLEELQSYGGVLTEQIRALEVRRILIDSLTAGPLSPDSSALERFFCDTIIRLSTEARRRSVRRHLEVVKSRGQGYTAGHRIYRIEGGSGVKVYGGTHARPKLSGQQPTATTRISSDNPLLDQMLGADVYEGSITLTVGISGTGKTVSGVQFLAQSIIGGGARSRCPRRGASATSVLK